MFKAICGFFMALADSVPGVSGGTIAFLLGIYDKFLGSITGLIYGKKAEKKQGLSFIAKWAIGWVIGFLLAIVVLTSFFESHIYEVSSLFMGFIIFSIPVIVIAEKNSVKGKYFNIVFAAVGFLLVVVLTYFNGADAFSADLTSMNIGTALYLLAAGACAITAMILPGISGSTILLIFGIYIPIMTGLKEIMGGNNEMLPAVAIFAVGIILGIVFVFRFIKIALEKARPQMVYLIIGLMVGSVYSIMQGPTTLDVPKPALAADNFSIPFFVCGNVKIPVNKKCKFFAD
jgi:putative membrane protein